MEAAKAGLSPEGIGSGDAPMIEPAEGARVCSLLGVRSKTPAMKAGAMVEGPSRRVKAIPIEDAPAVRNVGVVVVDHSPVVMPIVSPMVPAPAESAKEPNPEPESKRDYRPRQEQPWRWI